ncbi:hypothetical protein V2J09_010410 [Rumex salicifolius]
MEALSNLTCKPQPLLHCSLPRFPSFLRRGRHYHPRCPSISGSVSFKSPLSSSNVTIKASISDSPSSTSSSSSSFSLLKLPICIAAVSAALFVSRLSPFRPLPALAEAPAVETITEEARNDAVHDNEEKEVAEAEEEKELQEKLASNPNDAEALKTLLEFKMRNRHLQEVVEIASKLIELEPDDVEWPLLRGHTYCYMGEFEAAKPVFEEIIAKDPNRVEAYHGLVMSATQLDADDGKELDEVERRIQDAIGRLKKENKKADVRDFYLLIAQIRVIQGEYMDALNVYQDLVKQEPRDYRPYLCQGIIYTLLRKKKEAEEQFEKYKRLVPKEHPYADYFDNNVKNTAKIYQSF